MKSTLRPGRDTNGPKTTNGPHPGEAVENTDARVPHACSPRNELSVGKLGRVIPARMHKHCSHCGEWLRLGEFNVNRRMKDGRSSWCRGCARRRSPVDRIGLSALPSAGGLGNGSSAASVIAGGCGLARNRRPA
jgi:hypothetical protein